jgi:hypothetical protein
MKNSNPGEQRDRYMLRQSMPSVRMQVSSANIVTEVRAGLIWLRADRWRAFVNAGVSPLFLYNVGNFLTS